MAGSDCKAALKPPRRRPFAVACLLLATASTPSLPSEERTLAQHFAAEVDRRLEVPAEAQAEYAGLLRSALADSGIGSLLPQPLLLIDRNPQVQALLLFVLQADGAMQLAGASPVSTGKTGGFEYFETPLGVFRHAPGNPDFRAEGSRNANGILGYGPKGARVFDFGWQPARRSWRTGLGLMRLQMHATDPKLLEPRLGSPQSKGCIRIPLSLNRFIDRHGLLDADYMQAAAAGLAVWVLPAAATAPSWPGRYLVVVESGWTERPPWSPAP